MTHGNADSDAIARTIFVMTIAGAIVFAAAAFHFIR